MEPCDVFFYDRFVMRVPKPLAPEMFGGPPGSLVPKWMSFSGLTAKHCIGIAYVDDCGVVRVRKIRPDDPEYDTPELPAESKE